MAIGTNLYTPLLILTIKHRKRYYVTISSIDLPKADSKVWKDGKNRGHMYPLLCMDNPQFE
jgi:hypothetical protein